jgi:hypothetical protein
LKKIMTIQSPVSFDVETPSEFRGVERPQQIAASSPPRTIYASRNWPIVARPTDPGYVAASQCAPNRREGDVHRDATPTIFRQASFNTTSPSRDWEITPVFDSSGTRLDTAAQESEH